MHYIHRQKSSTFNGFINDLCFHLHMHIYKVNLAHVRGRLILPVVICCASPHYIGLLCSMLPTTLTSIIVNLFDFWNGQNQVPAAVVSTQAQSALSFELRHLHAVSPAAHVVFADVPTAEIYIHSDERVPYRVRTRELTSFRPPSFEAHSQARLHSIRYGQSHALRWEEDVIVGPDVESRETLLELAKMTNNAYVEPTDAAWYDLGGNWTHVSVCSL